MPRSRHKKIVSRLSPDLTSPVLVQVFLDQFWPNGIAMPEVTGVSLGLGEYQTRVDCTESPVPHDTINFVVTADIIIIQEHLV